MTDWKNKLLAFLHDPCPSARITWPQDPKAERAALYALGRTLRLPIYYLHETFKVSVELP